MHGKARQNPMHHMRGLGPLDMKDETLTLQ